MAWARCRVLAQGGCERRVGRAWVSVLASVGVVVGAGVGARGVGEGLGWVWAWTQALA